MYFTMFRELISEVLDLLVPPRPTERVVRLLTLDELHDLAQEDGLPYHDPRVTALIWELKYYGTRRARQLAGAYLAEVLMAVAAEELGKPLLIPIPMHQNRRRERGHNQTELLCKAALSFTDPVGFEYAPTALVRVVNTKTQQGLPRQVRLRNVHGSMAAGPGAEKIKDRVCVVVDDVTTTGATLQEAQRVLRLCGARAVHVTALARS